MTSRLEMEFEDWWRKNRDEMSKPQPIPPQVLYHRIWREAWAAAKKPASVHDVEEYYREDNEDD